MTRELFLQHLDLPLGLSDVFERLAPDSPGVIWLDSQTGGRFSYLAFPSPGDKRLSFNVGDSEDPFETVQDYLTKNQRPHNPDLAFEFQGGLIGYLGYEMKAYTGGQIKHTSPYPDAQFVEVNRFLVQDHDEGRITLACLAESLPEAQNWFNKLLQDIESKPLKNGGKASFGLKQDWLQSQQNYVQNIAQIQELIKAGWSYEVCLTNKLKTDFPQSESVPFYLKMRSENSAPYGAYLGLGGLSVLSTSPECFLKLDAQNRLSSKPIKGTFPRGSTENKDQVSLEGLKASQKDQSENLMIVDLVRNDLGRVCEVGSVTVDKLMDIESFATVHQMVSTISGQLKPNETAVGGLRAAFPPGSMTGAPKIKTMEIIDDFEPEARGIYSGAIGYLSATGPAQFSVVIRTAVIHENRLEYGSGGAITALSLPQNEWEEVELKAQSLMKTTQ